MKRFVKNIAIALLLFLLVAAIFSFSSDDSGNAETVSLSRVAELVGSKQIEKIEVSENELLVALIDGSKLKAKKEPESSLSESLLNLGVTTEALQNLNVEVKGPSGASVFVSVFLPFLIPLLLIGVFIYFLMRQVSGANNRALSFGQSSAKLSETGDIKSKVTFEDVAGAVEAKEELNEVVEFLRYPQKFLKIGARIPKGVLLLGAPGVGKTLLARAVAGEANVPFFHMSGSEFVEMFVGVGASRTRDLFRKAKKHAPCIVFIDEIDAVGRQRGSGLGGSHDEREQTLNQILVEMDGFDTDTNVIVVAATNRPDVLDPALLRPGRFDRQVIIDLPDITDREAILKVHSKNKPMDKSVALRTIAERTPGFSGADLANLVNEAAILAARLNKNTVSQNELIEAIEKVMLGPERKSHILSVDEKKITAYHEAGHALVAAMLKDADTVHKVSIISRGRAAGYTLKLPDRDKHLKSKKEFLAELAVALGGYSAEQLVFDELTTGAANDLQVATKLARKLVTAFGMSERLGPVTFGESHEMIFLGRDIGEQRNYSEKVAQKIDEEVSKFLADAHKKALSILKKYRGKLEEISARLIEKETIEQEEFASLISKSAGAKKKPFGTKLTSATSPSL